MQPSTGFSIFNTGDEDGNQRTMAAVNIEIQGISPFECKGNSSALAPRWKKWLQSFQYFLVAKGVVNDAQKKALLLRTAGIEVQELYETLTDPGTDTFEEDTTKEYEKTVRTLNAYFVTKLNESYERRIQKHDSTGWRDS